MKMVAALCFAALLFGGMGLLGLFWAGVTFTRGEYLTTLAMLGLVVFCFGLLAMVGIVKAGKVRVRGQFDSEGTLLRPDRKVDVTMQVVGVAGFGAMLLYAIFAPLGKMDIPTPPGLGQGYFSIASAAGVVAGLPALWKTINGKGGMSLRLSPAGFQLRSSAAVDAGWNDVRDVTDRRPRGKTSARSLVVIVLEDGRAPAVDGATFTPDDGRALREMVRFYWHHPEHRAELTDGRALQRLRDNAF